MRARKFVRVNWETKTTITKKIESIYFSANTSSKMFGRKMFPLQHIQTEMFSTKNLFAQKTIPPTRHWLHKTFWPKTFVADKQFPVQKKRAKTFLSLCWNQSRADCNFLWCLKLWCWSAIWSVKTLRNDFFKLRVIFLDSKLTSNAFERCPPLRMAPIKATENRGNWSMPYSRGASIKCNGTDVVTN